MTATEFSLDGKVSVLESASFYGGRENNLSYDYFQTNSIDDFAEFLRQNLTNKDWIHTNHLKNNPMDNLVYLKYDL